MQPAQQNQPSGEPFPPLTLDEAPSAVRGRLRASAAELGYLPTALAQLAASPELVEVFQRGLAAFEATDLDPVAREVVVLTVAVHNGCRVCVALHTARLTALAADPRLIDALRSGTDIEDPRLRAVQHFTSAVLDTAGAVSRPELDAFLASGYTPTNALEVTLGVGVYTLSTFANRLVRAPVDPPLARFA